MCTLIQSVYVRRLTCKIRPGLTEPPFKPTNVTVSVREDRKEDPYFINGIDEMPGFTFVVIYLIYVLKKRKKEIGFGLSKHFRNISYTFFFLDKWLRNVSKGV